MERSKIPMLSRFDLISHIMPYYGETHRAFLLLSGLCSETRCKLDEFYDAFVTCMKEYWLVFEAYQSKKLNSLFLPNDLFEFNISSIFNEEMFDAFINFVEKLSDSKGWYFNSHFMHSKIKIRDPIEVNIKYIDTLYIYVDVLKSTQVILCKRDTHTSKIRYESDTLDTNCSYAFFILKRLMLTSIVFTNFFFTNRSKIKKIMSLFYF